MQINKKYQAFISYRHTDNQEAGRQWATWLHHTIETYEVPKELIGNINSFGEKIPARIYPIFRDEEELSADADLGTSIIKALDSTKMLIVLCSPQAVASTYVSQEIDYFKKQGSSHRIIAAMIDGEPNASWDSDKQTNGLNKSDECFPIPLQYEYDNNGNRTKKHAEPIAADFRINYKNNTEQGWTSIEAYHQHLKSTTDLDNKTIQKTLEDYHSQQQLMLLKIIARILGVPLGELTQRDKLHQLEKAKIKAKKLKRWLSAVFLLALIAMTAGIIAYFKQQEAIYAQIETEKQLVQANHNYGIALFEKAKQEANDYNFNKSNFYAANALIKVKKGKYKHQISSLLSSNLNKNKTIWISPYNPLSDGKISSIDYSPDGKTLASGSFDGYIRLWDMLSGKHRDIFVGNDIKIRKLAYLPDGKTLVFISGNIIYIWDIVTAKQITAFKGDTKDITSIAISPNGDFIASSSRDKTIRLWNVKTGKQQLVFRGHEKKVFAIAFSPDGKTLASGSYDLTVRLWDIATKTQLTILKGHTNIVWTVIFSPDGRTLASGSFDNTIRLWDIATGKEKKVFKGHKDFISSIQFSKDGETLASGSNDKTIRLWDVKTGKIQATLAGHNSIVKALRFSNDGRTLASASFDNTIRLWDIQQLLFKDFKHDAYAISPNSENLISALSPLSNTTGHLWDVATGKLKALLTGHDGVIDSASFSLNGNTYASGSRDNTIIVWDLISGKQLARFRDYNNKSSLALSPDGKTLAYGLKDKTITLINIATGKQIATFQGQDNGNNLVFSPDGKTLAISISDSIGLWNIVTKQQQRKIDIHTDEVTDMTYSPDGKNLVFISGSTNIKLFNTLTGKEQLGFKGHSDSIISIAFSPDGKTMASGSFDKTIRLWDITTGKPLAILDGHNDLVISVAFSIDGKTIISGSIDKTVRKWNIELYQNLTKDNNYVNQWIKEQSHLFNYQINGIDLSIEPPEKLKIINPKHTKYQNPNWPKTHPNYWIKNAQNGDSVAMFQLGVIYHRSSDNKKARKWYENALKAGNKAAQKRLTILGLTEVR